MVHQRFKSFIIYFSNNFDIVGIVIPVYMMLLHHLVYQVFRNNNVCCFKTFWNTLRQKHTLHRYVRMMTPLSVNSFSNHGDISSMQFLYLYTFSVQFPLVVHIWCFILFDKFLLGWCWRIPCVGELKQGAESIVQSLLHHFLFRIHVWLVHQDTSGTCVIDLLSLPVAFHKEQSLLLDLNSLRTFQHHMFLDDLV